MFGELRAGFEFLRRNTYLAGNTLLLTIMPLAAGAATAMTPMYSMLVLGAGAWGFALLEASMGLGSILGGIGVSRFGQRYRKGHLILLGFGGFGLSIAALALTSNLYLALMLFALDGLANMLFYIPSVTLVQELTPSGFRGRVFSLRSALIRTGMMISSALGGMIAESINVQAVFLLAGGLVILFSLASAFIPSIRDVR